MQIVPATALLEISKRYEGHRIHREAGWHGYDEGKTWGALPYSVSTLYRGQNARHVPMLASIGRGLQSTDIVEIYRSSISDQANIVLRLAQAWWFSRELARHPISQHATEQHLDLDPIALAQHYGIPTGYLDLTDDFNVSAFFATCYEINNKWEPVDSGVGVIYRVHLKELDTPFGSYTPLGPQQLPRPSQQCAWVTELPFCHSFEGWPHVEMLQFSHNRHVGEYFLEMFSGGKSLFPPDPLSNVAEEILACHEIPVDLVEAALNSFVADPYGILPEHLPAIRKEISKHSDQVDYRKLLTDQHVTSLLADQRWRDKMLSEVRVKWPLVRRMPISQINVNTKQDTAD
jgi:hypothetical protein